MGIGEILVDCCDVSVPPPPVVPPQLTPCCDGISISVQAFESPDRVDIILANRCPGSDITYIVERKLFGQIDSAYTQIGTIAATTFTDSSVSSSTTYTYRVRAISNQSPATCTPSTSPAVSVTTGGGIVPPGCCQPTLTFSAHSVEAGTDSGRKVVVPFTVSGTNSLPSCTPTGFTLTLGGGNPTEVPPGTVSGEYVIDNQPLDTTLNFTITYTRNCDGTQFTYNTGDIPGCSNPDGGLWPYYLAANGSDASNIYGPETGFKTGLTTGQIFNNAIMFMTAGYNGWALPPPNDRTAIDVLDDFPVCCGTGDEFEIRLRWARGTPSEGSHSLIFNSLASSVIGPSFFIGPFEYRLEYDQPNGNRAILRYLGPQQSFTDFYQTCNACNAWPPDKNFDFFFFLRRGFCAIYIFYIDPLTAGTEFTTCTGCDQLPFA